MQALRDVGEVYVIDSQSTGDTVEIARSHGAKVVQFHYQGGWPKKRQWAMNTLPLAYDWVLLFDADEILTPELADEIRSAIPNPAVDGYHPASHLVMFGQWNHFASYAVEKIPYAIERYSNEVKRLHRVLEHRLVESRWLAGDEYSMADIITFPWIRGAEQRNIDLAGYPSVKRWHDEMAARPAVQRGVAVLADKSWRGPVTDAERENYFGATQFAAR